MTRLQILAHCMSERLAPCQHLVRSLGILIAVGLEEKPLTLYAFFSTPTALDCDVNTDGNSGCGVQAAGADSFGPAFNSAGGGFYAMERTTDFIKIWFWSRGDAVPSDVSNSVGTVDTDNWVYIQALQ